MTIGGKGSAAGIASLLSRRDSRIALAGLAGITALAWAWLWWDAAAMDSMIASGDGMAAMAVMPAVSAWRPELLFPAFLMWSIMMVGMMLPSAAPAILLYGSMAGGRRPEGRALPAVWIFTGGYLAVWTGFSAAAAALQVALQAQALVTPMLVSASPVLTGGLLVTAGLYQWLPVKDVCLRNCRAPLQFFLVRWRPGLRGAFRMGAEHGLLCLGCCWALMLLLFAAGVMNLLWVALIAAFVFLEKLLPAGRLAGRLTGIGLVAGGVAVATLLP